MASTSGCPFGFGSTAHPLRDSNASPTPRLPTGKARMKLLYEEYVHLPALRAVWESPITENPVLEPLFAAGFHGVELGFLLLSEFISDSRNYVAKRPRIERVADDIGSQCKLLVEVIDGELEEEGTKTNRLSLAQEFPFPGAPPSRDYPSHSPGLARLEASIRTALPAMSQAERNSIIKVVINLTGSFGSFHRWNVGLGVEPQLNSLREAVGLPPLEFHKKLWLDYTALVRPQLVVERTLTDHNYTYHEDFFFRTVHLGTDCWAKVVLARLESAKEYALMGQWHVASARILQASRILEYLGSHVMLLTSMNLRDYLLLKVELEGTSGEGSIQVKSFRKAVAALFPPLAAALLPPSAEDDGSTEDYEVALGKALMQVYEFPDCETEVSGVGPKVSNREAYNYAKALEDVESGLLGGFYFKHFRLAANVIGSDAKGTMRRAVQALKSTYETPVFPILDRIRSGLGAKVDAELAHVKGRMMQEIIDAYLSREETAVIVSTKKDGTGNELVDAVNVIADAAAVAPESSATLSSATSAHISPSASALQKLYSWDEVPGSSKIQIESALKKLASTTGDSDCIAFLDHAWGKIPPSALQAALTDLAALYTLGNPAWDELFGKIMPRAARHIQQLLGIPLADDEEESSPVVVHFGHNSHELVTRLLSQLLISKQSAMSVGADREKKVHILTSDAEFYSIVRQLNRLAQEDVADINVIPAEPIETFAERCLQAATEKSFDVVYLSQVDSLQQRTLLPNLSDFVPKMHSVLHSSHQNQHQMEPLLLIDGYHSFCAMAAPLGPIAAEKCCFLGGLIKHAGSGPNCAFITVPKSLNAKLRPVLTGWLADPSVLAPTSAGIKLGSTVQYSSDLALLGGTPAFFLPLITFDYIQQKVLAQGISLEAVHEHVSALQELFLEGIPPTGCSGVTRETFIGGLKGSWRSHTLVFKQESPEQAAAVVETAKRHKVLIDSRKEFVRVGFGPNHTAEDVEKLLMAVTAA